MKKIEGITVETAKTTEEIVANIRRNVRSENCLEVTKSLDWRENCPIAIIGGGPSLQKTIGELENFRYTMVCGSAHDYVIKNSKNKPTYAIICDPDPLIVNYIQENSLYTKYLVASQCDPKVFDYLRYNKVFMWHCDGGETFDYSEFGVDTYPINGGCTVGTRAICMALGFGFNNIHLFGFDTCLDKDYKHHAYEFNDPEKETLGNIVEIALDGPEGKKFNVAGYMLGQLTDFQKLLQMYSTRMQVTIHGDGLLKYLMDLANKKILEVQNADQR